MDASGYALRKVIPNQTVVREIDEVRQREMWQWACIGVVLVLVLLVSAYEQHWMNFQHGSAVVRLQQQRAIEDEKNRQLRLEVETLKAPQRIEGMAKQYLQMITPAPGQSIVIERVRPTDRPPSSVVAAR